LFNGFAVLRYATALQVINPSLQLFYPCESGSEKQGKFSTHQLSETGIKGTEQGATRLWMIPFDPFDPFRGVRQIQG